MFVLFCSGKLSKILKINRKETATENIDFLGNWNAHLFYVDRKKCLIIVNKLTRYSVILLDFRMSEFKQLPTILYSSLMGQLTADGLYTPQRAELFKNHFSDILFSTTDNDKSIIGTINDYIYLFSVGDGKGELAIKDYKTGLAASYLNETPLGMYKFSTAIENLNNLFLEIGV